MDIPASRFVSARCESCGTEVRSAFHWDDEFVRVRCECGADVDIPVEGDPSSTVTDGQRDS